ncbi:MAG: efflux RND transporter periplasmic adaptor subunit [Gammaproteobacteria bacterium TMED92]|nr:MAG: efflux RND transporter periplasmic adaptor subunit [Gammaproteobacteria bacterium TMED92]
MNMRATYIWSLTIAALLAVWLISGQINSAPPEIDPSIAEQNRTNNAVSSDAIPTRVRAQRVRAVEKIRYASIRGKTQNKRTVTTRAEIVGRVVERRVERGDAVRADTVLCELSVEDRQSALVEARQVVNQASIDYQGALELQAKGFNSDSAIAAAKARLASAAAQLKRKELAVEKILIRAPFDGLVEDVHVEIGDYVNPGQSCATLVDLNPMLMVGRVSEKAVLSLRLGELAIGQLADGRTVEGPVTFIGQQSDPQTRTYAIEIQLDNSDRSLRSGITAEIKIPVDRVLAQRVSPALFALDDRGEIGVRVLDSNNIVHFHNVEIVSDDSDGVWVTGLPNETALITVGQEMVVAGERVDPDFQNLSSSAVASSLAADAQTSR